MDWKFWGFTSSNKEWISSHYRWAFISHALIISYCSLEKETDGEKILNSPTNWRERQIQGHGSLDLFLAWHYTNATARGEKIRQKWVW